MSDSLRNHLCESVLFALKAHENQVDKSGKPYGLHPLNVMFRVIEASLPEGVTLDYFGAMAAIGHDLVEDQPVTFEDLLKVMPIKSARAIEALSHTDRNETYHDYIKRVCENDVARRVKKCDIAHNASEDRLQNIDIDDAEYLRKKYAKALKQIQAWEEENL